MNVVVIKGDVYNDVACKIKYDCCVRDISGY